MPMEDRLNLPRNNPVIEDKKQTEILDNNLFNPLKIYPGRLKKECDKYNGKIADYNPYLVEPFYEYIRFNSDLSIYFAPVPRDDLVAIFKGQDSDLCSILDKTDLCNIFPDKFFLDREESYAKLPMFLREKISLDNLLKFKYATNDNFVIPSLSFLSFFIKDGETLRRYTQVVDDVDSSILFLSKVIFVKDKTATNGQKKCLLFNQFYFNLESMKKFYDSTGIGKIETMVEDTSTLLAEIDILDKRYKATSFSGKRPIKKIIRILYRRLFSNNQQLI